MIVQWCIKGLALPGDDEARALIDGRSGISSRWLLKYGRVSLAEFATKLTEQNLDRHVNHFERKDPATGLPFCEESPFISLSCGTVERDAVAKTNFVHTARHTALWFGTQFGARREAYLYTCWVVLAPRSAVSVHGVAEEIRDLNTYRRYSPFQTEGEVTAKVYVPATQVRSCEKWTWDHGEKRLRKEWDYLNPHFTEPEALSNVRELI
ncbi:hypothetical protein ACFZC7_13115 [Streptomyces massasporeus]|uniref:hypothetical protein n=1 Tax=Streptomyces massasporeus TaxID=67324 RepID=UPI0036E34860